MIVERTGTNIRFKFEPKEWKIRDRGACQDFISRIRPYISGPWDPETKFWTISQDHEKFFQDLREELFEHPNQPGLF